MGKFSFSFQELLCLVNPLVLFFPDVEGVISDPNVWITIVGGVSHGVIAHGG